MDTINMTPAQARLAIRAGQITGNTSGMCPGYAQANLAILPRDMAYDFLLFTQRNPKSCPVLEVTDVGARELKYIAAGCDIATDIPKYRVYRRGELTDEITDISGIWREDFVSFLIGCSFSFESELIAAGIEVRHISQGRNVPMYITNIDTQPAGAFSGKMVVSMRPVRYEQLARAVTVTAALPRVHGAPVHIGEPAHIGISDISRPDFGDAVDIYSGEQPVFWACGVTPQSVAMSAKPELMITHSPGHMLITDIKNVDLKE